MHVFSLELQSDLMRDLTAFLPEAIVAGTVVLLLVIRLLKGMEKVHLGSIALAMTVVALAMSVGQWDGREWAPPAEPSAFASTARYFTGLLAYDHFTQFLRLVLLSFTALTIFLTFMTGIPDREDSGDFYVLLLGGTLGMMLMASANHLLMAYMAVEMASLPSYALSGFLKGKRQSSEAALKYVVYGGGASGIMLYGISLVAGTFGTGYLPDVAKGVAAVAAAPGIDLTVLMGVLFIIIGLAFKLSAVPFHFWCPDVFEGASAEVAAFLSVASKAGAMALTLRLLLVLTNGGTAMVRDLAVPLMVLAGVTATFGNLAAYAQTNLKRLLAYSTIAHAGYMIMGLSTLDANGGLGVLFYLAVYSFMNLGAFAVVALIRNQTGSEDLSSYRGMGYRAPALTAFFAIFLLSLLGLPPMAGFVAKLWVFASVYEAFQRHIHTTPWLGAAYLTLLVVGGLNTVLSAIYYLRVLKTMILEKPIEEIENRPVPTLGVPEPAVVFVGVLAVVVMILGVLFNPLAQASDRGVSAFRAGKPAAGIPVAVGEKP